MKAKILISLLFFGFIGLILISPELTFSQERGRVKTLRGKLSLPYPGAPEDAAKKFLKDNSAVFQMDPEIKDLQIESIKESLVGYHVQFNQIFGSLPVFNGGIEIHLEKDKSVFLVHSYYLPNIKISTLPVLSEEDGVQIVKNHFLQNYRSRNDKTGELQSYEGKKIVFKEKPKPQLGIFEHQGKPHLVYKILLNLESPFALMEYTVDADTGTILEWVNLIQEVVGFVWTT